MPKTHTTHTMYAIQVVEVSRSARKRGWTRFALCTPAVLAFDLNDGVAQAYPERWLGTGFESVALFDRVPTTLVSKLRVRGVRFDAVAVTINGPRPGGAR